MRDKRFLGKLNIVAFSDPNDLLTYTIEPDFVKKYINLRNCPIVTNILINVADPIDIKITEFANPQKAHLGYSADTRVIDLIVNGTLADSISGCQGQVFYFALQYVLIDSLLIKDCEA